MGVRARRVEKYYQDLLGEEIKSRDSVEQQNLQSENSSKMSNTASISVPEKWKGQIEKVTTYMSFLNCITCHFIFVRFIFGRFPDLSFQAYCFLYAGLASNFPRSSCFG